MSVDLAEPQKRASIKHLSWSGISEYRTCPRRFYYHKVACVPEESRSASLVFGGAIHKAIEKIYEAKLEGRKAPSVQALLAAYESAWGAEAKDGPPITYPKGESQEILKDTASRMLKAFRTYALRTKSKIIAIEHEAFFTLLPGVVPLKARLDLVEIEGHNLVLSDWKTSKSRWSENKTAESLPQLVVYAAAVANLVRELGLKKIQPRFVILTKAKTPVVQLLEPKASQADVVRLKELVSETADAINKGVFPRREGWPCGYCPFAKQCLGNGAATGTEGQT
jgi:putative RecB family exonuclease